MQYLEGMKIEKVECIPHVKDASHMEIPHLQPETAILMRFITTTNVLLHVSFLHILYHDTLQSRFQYISDIVSALNTGGRW
jgi:hypothetical protein